MWTVHLVQGRRRWTGDAWAEAACAGFVLGDFANFTEARHLGRGDSEELSSDWPVEVSVGLCWCCFTVNRYGRTEPTVGATSSGLVALGCRRSQAEQAFLPGLSFSFFPQVSCLGFPLRKTVTCEPNKSLFPLSQNPASAGQRDWKRCGAGATNTQGSYLRGQSLILRFIFLFFLLLVFCPYFFLLSFLYHLRQNYPCKEDYLIITNPKTN